MDKPTIWLQGDEASGTAECGCVLSTYGPEDAPGPAFYQCHLHASAGALLAALERLFTTLERVDLVPATGEFGDHEEIKDQWDADCDAARAVIHTARGDV